MQAIKMRAASSCGIQLRVTITETNKQVTDIIKPLFQKRDLGGGAIKVTEEENGRYCYPFVVFCLGCERCCSICSRITECDYVFVLVGAFLDIVFIEIFLSQFLKLGSFRPVALKRVAKSNSWISRCQGRALEIDLEGACICAWS